MTFGAEPSREPLALSDEALADTLGNSAGTRLAARIADSLPSIVFLYDLGERRLVYANRQAERNLGYGAAELEQLGSQIVHPDDHDRVRHVHNLLSRACDDDVIDSDLRLRRAGGSWGWYHARCVVFSRDEVANSVRLVLCTIRDITERKELERQIAQLVDQERLRLGQLLHDSLGQQLTGISLLSERLRQQLEREGSSEVEHAASLVEHIKEAQKQSRALARGLLPVEVDSAGLMSALERFVRDAQALHAVEIEFICREPVDVENNTVATHLYYIACEASKSALKRAGTTRVAIELRQTDGAVVLSICDDGRAAARDDVRPDFGRKFMEYRADLIGAALDVRTDSEAGTTVTCTLRH